MTYAQSPVRLGIGDPMPRIVLPLASGGVFDSWHQADAGRTQIYWLDMASARPAAEALAATLTECEAEMRAVTAVPPDEIRLR